MLLRKDGRWDPLLTAPPPFSTPRPTLPQVGSLNSLLGLKLSAVGKVDARAAERLETLLMEQHPLLGRYEKVLSFLLRFACDAHLDCTGESLADWLAPADGDRSALA